MIKLPLTMLTTAMLLAAMQFGAAADLTLPAIFGDHMVLQRDNDAPVWGIANPGDAITVTAGNVIGKTTADSAGKWMVRLKNLPVSNTPIIMKIEGPKNAITFKDVLVGDVWLASGQSNMDWKFNQDSLYSQQKPLATNSLIRVFYCAPSSVSRPSTKITVDSSKGCWRVCSPATIDPISAVGYYFARDIAAYTGHPVALIHSAVGGSTAQSWTSLEALSAVPKLNAHAAEGLKIRSQSEGTLGVNWNSVCANFNGGIYPYIPYGLKGVIWYQGESNTTQPAYISAPDFNPIDDYQILLPTMMQDWRTRWGRADLPFIIVQLPKPTGSPEMTRAQISIASLPNNGLALTYDIGSTYSLNQKIAASASPPAYLLSQQIHPTYKHGVGIRLALAARKVAYGDKQVVYSGPTFTGVKFTGNQARVQFGNLGGGLKIGVPPGDWNPSETRVRTDALLGFEIAGADKVFHQATSNIDGGSVLVSHPSVPTPKYVRYGYTDLEYGKNNLYNQENLPAVPFNSDASSDGGALK